jgi:hypothetical protein
MTSLIQLTQTLFLNSAPLLAQVDYSYTTRQAPWSNLLDLLAGGRRFDDRGFMEGFLKSRTSRLRGYKGNKAIAQSG